MKQFTEKITAIIVTYNPDSSCIEGLIATINQVNQLVIVDNASSGDVISKIQDFTDSNKDRVSLIINPQNIGLSKAQNIGIAHALEQNCDWVLLLDDDSRPDENMVQAMMHEYQQQDNPAQIAILVPFLRETQTSQPPAYITKQCGLLFKRSHFTGAQSSLFVLCAIASGSLIKADILHKHGLMYEDFFIDYIDTEYCLRLIDKGYNILAVKNAILYHTLGEKTEHRLNIVTANHSPQRRYTIYRNRVIVWKNYMFRVPSYIIYDIMASLYDLLRITFYEQNKLAKISSALKGFWDGVWNAY